MVAPCSREDSKEHPHLAGIYSYTEVRSIERVSSKNATFNSFRVEISVSDLSKVLDPEFWPTGVCVRRFYVPTESRQTANNGINT